MLAFGALSYSDRFVSGKPPPDVLYRWTTFEGAILQYAIFAAIVWGIAGLGNRRLLFAVRRPRSWREAAAIAVGLIVGIYILTAILGPLLHPGREQGLTPTRWEPSHAMQYVANGLAISVVAPIVEELTFRGLGFSLLRRYGERLAIVGVGILFGLAHGLVEALPLLVAFGIGLAILRSRTNSVVPGIVVHGVFNASALVFAVAH